MISNVPFNTSAEIGTGAQFTEIFAVSGQDVSATVNITVLSIATQSSPGVSPPINLQMALIPSNQALTASIQPSQYVQPKDIIIGQNGVNSGILECSAIIIPNGMKLVAKASESGLVGRAHGFLRRQTA